MWGGPPVASKMVYRAVNSSTSSVCRAIVTTHACHTRYVDKRSVYIYRSIKEQDIRNQGSGYSEMT